MLLDEFINRFVCPYHGWTYSLEGRLTKALRLKGIKGFKAKDFGLKQIAAETFGPLVFINLNPNADSKELRDLFQEVYERLEERHLNVTYCRWLTPCTYSQLCRTCPG